MAKHKRNHNKVSRNSAVNMPATNRNYKDTIFRMLFSDRKNLLSSLQCQSIRENTCTKFYRVLTMVRTAIADCTELRLSLGI